MIVFDSALSRAWGDEKTKETYNEKIINIGFSCTYF